MKLFDIPCFFLFEPRISFPLQQRKNYKFLVPEEIRSPTNLISCTLGGYSSKRVFKTKH